MKIDMKFPCLVTCNTVQCVAINENHVIHLEGDRKGQVCIATTIYTEPEWGVYYDSKTEDKPFLYNSLENAIEYFKPVGFTNIREHINVTNIDFSPWKGDTKLFFDDVDTLTEQQPWKPTVGEQVSISYNTYKSVVTGELLFLGEEYFVLKTNGGEAAYSLKNCEITKPVTPESKLKDLWFECDQDIDLFIAQVSKQYEEV